MIGKSLFDSPPEASDPMEAKRFAGWIRRPDRHGRMGYEAPGLAESARWWARRDFDELPEQPIKSGPISREMAGGQTTTHYPLTTTL